MRTHRSARLGVIVALAALTLTACSTTPSALDGDALTVTDPWVKAVDDGMTAAFGVITNNTDQDIVIVSASTAASPAVELHEVVNNVMQEKGDGFTVPANGSITLEPGGWHIMFMGVTAAISPGDEIDITLALADGTTHTFTATAKEFAGGNEDYDGHGDMGHGDDEHTESDH